MDVAVVEHHPAGHSTRVGERQEEVQGVARSDGARPQSEAQSASAACRAVGDERVDASALGRLVGYVSTSADFRPAVTNGLGR